MSLARKGAGVFLIQWVAVPVTLVNQVILARWLGADGVGAYSILTSAVVLLTAVGGLGLPGVAIYIARKGFQTDRSLLAHATVLTIAVTLFVAASAALFKRAFLVTFFQGVTVGGGALGLTLISLPFSLILTFAGSLMLGRGQAAAYAWLTAGLLLAELVGILVLVAGLGFGLAGALSTFTGARVILTVITVGIVLRTTRGQGCPVRLADLGQLLKFGLQHYLGSLGPQAFMRLNHLILGYFMDARAVGFYSVAAACYFVILTVPRAVTALLTGWASSVDPHKAAFVVARASRVILWVMAVMGILIGVAAPWLIPFFFGAPFAASVNPLPFLLAAGVLAGFGNGLQTYFLGVGRPGVNGVLALVAGIVNVGLNVALIPPMGIVGSALAAFLSAALGAFLLAVLFRCASPVPFLAMVRPTRDDLATLRERFLGRPVSKEEV